MAVKSAVVERWSNVIGGYLSWVMDAYDLGAVLITAPILGSLFFPRSGGLLLLLYSSLPIAFTVVFRPLGGLIFGYIGDRFGRRTSLLITVLGYSLSIGLTGFLPTYAQVGVLATIALIILRSLQGIFIGGDISGGFTISMESIYRLRGFFSGVFQSGVLLGFVIVDLLSTYLALTLGKAYLSFGWRIIYWVGMVPAILAAFIRLSMAEPIAWVKRQRLSPFKALYPLPQVFMVMLGMWVMVYASSTFMPIFLAAVLKLPPSLYAPLLVVFNAVGIPAMIIAGYASDKLGRKYAGIISAIIAAASAAWFYMTVNAQNLTMELLLFGFLLNLPSGIVPAYLAERFKTHGRATGVGTGYNGPFIIAGWTSTIIAMLSRIINPYGSAMTMFLIGALISIVGLVIGPETRHTDLSTWG